MPGHVKPFHALSPAVIKGILASLQRHPSKQHGQNFLHSRATVAHMIESCGFKESDVVLEVGPGLGALTFNIARLVRAVVAVEIEPAFVSFLQAEIDRSGVANVSVIQADALVHEIPPEVTAIVSSMPYSIAAPLTFKFLDAVSDRGIHAHVMCQEAFAMKLVARPGTTAYSRLSANAALLARVDIIMKVSRNNFFPVPKVDSCFVKLSPRPGVDPGMARDVMNVTRHLFPFKNKTVPKAVKLYMERAGAAGAGQAGIDLSRFSGVRVRDLVAEDLIELVLLLRQHGGAGEQQDASARELQ